MNISCLIPNTLQGSNIKGVNNLTVNGRQLLIELGINPDIIPYEIKTVNLSILNKLYTGIAISNKRGGMEFYSKQLVYDLYQRANTYRHRSIHKACKAFERSKKTMRRAALYNLNEEAVINKIKSDSHINLSVPHILTLKEDGITFFPYKKRFKSSYCCVFSSFLDCLSYMTLIKENLQPGLPMYCDCIIVNKPSNFPVALLDCEQYKHIYCFFPRTHTGRVMASTFYSRSKRHCSDMSQLYSNFIDLYHFMTYKKNIPMGKKCVYCAARTGCFCGYLNKDIDLDTGNKAPCEDLENNQS